MTPTITIEPYEKHVLLCCGKYCDENRETMIYLKKRLQEEGLDGRIRANRAGCLGVCAEGAIMVVHPEGTWYCNVDQAAVDRIIASHFKAGAVVEDLRFHQHQP
ncbi:MAG: ferredoxin [Zetaproteobacteria bacterium]|nr:ferredoxin [Zetaproteobacteria bacterium]